MDKITIENLSIQYSDGTESLKNINLSIQANTITVLFGPAGGGKSAAFPRACSSRWSLLLRIR